MGARDARRGGELVLAAWDIRGGKLWTTFVEPPWHYSVEGDILFLDAMGAISSFPVTLGPPRRVEPR